MSARNSILGLALVSGLMMLSSQAKAGYANFMPGFKTTGYTYQGVRCSIDNYNSDSNTFVVVPSAYGATFPNGKSVAFAKWCELQGKLDQDGSNKLAMRTEADRPNPSDKGLTGVKTRAQLSSNDVERPNPSDKGMTGVKTRGQTVANGDLDRPNPSETSQTGVKTRRMVVAELINSSGSHMVNGVVNDGSDSQEMPDKGFTGVKTRGGGVSE